MFWKNSRFERDAASGRSCSDVDGRELALYRDIRADRFGLIT
jgi:hypothetical protein